MQDERRAKHIQRQNFTALAILIIGTILSFLLFGPKKDIPDNASASPEQTSKTVKTVQLSRANSSRAILEKTVKIDATDSGSAVAESSGRIKEVNFEVGDFVKEGQILAIFDQSSLVNSTKVSLESSVQSLELAENNLKQTKEIAEEAVDLASEAVDLAEIQLKQARAGADQDAIELAKQGLKIAEDQKDQAENSAKAQVNGARIQLEQAQLGNSQAQIGYDKTFIKAPNSGFVVSKNVSQEDYINPGTVIAQIAKEGKLVAKIYLNQDEINRVAEDDDAQIVVGDKTYSATVDSISNIANESNQRFEITVRTEADLVKEANKVAKVILNLRLENSQGFFIPLEAVSIGQTKREVFIAKEGKAMAIEVEMGKIIGKQVEIIKGLRENDLVIIEGGRNLQEGELVTSL